MSNTICIKHGANVPSNGTLQPYELGYVTSTGMLVIGQEDGSIKKFNHLQLDDNGYIPTLYSDGNLMLKSTSNNPKFWVEATSKGTKGSFGIQGSNGQIYMLAYPSNSTLYERYNLPAPSTSLAETIDYTILTTKGGAFDGTFNFNEAVTIDGKLTANGEVTINGKLTANGAIVVDSDSYGDTNPNEAGKTGVVGQLYFVIPG